MNSLARYIALATGLALSARGQTPQGRDHWIRVASELVVVDAQVLDRRNAQVVFGLAPDDFALYEDGVKQQITHFSQDTWPLSVLLVIDTSSSVWPYFSRLRREALEAMNHLRPEDEVAVIATAARTEVIQGFTRDKGAMTETVLRFDERTLGDDGILIHDAVRAAAVYLSRAAQPGNRRAIVFVTDDIATQSRFTSEEQALDKAAESDSTICGIVLSPFDPLSRKKIKHHPLRRVQFYGTVETYAAKTGGEVLRVKNEDVAFKLADVLHRLRTRYSLGYAPSNSQRDAGFRTIRLELTPEARKREPSAVVRTKQDYHARP